MERCLIWFGRRVLEPEVAGLWVYGLNDRPAVESEGWSMVIPAVVYMG